MHSLNRRVVDLSEAPDPQSDEYYTMSEEEFLRWERYMEHTEKATLTESGVTVYSNIFCDQIEKGGFCNGKIELKRLDLPKEIHWKCDKCGDKGKIINFSNSPWDLSHLSKEEREEYLSFDPSDLDIDLLEDWDDDILGPPPGDEAQLNDFENWIKQKSPEELQQLIEENNKKYGIVDPDLISLVINSDWTIPGAPIYLTDKVTADALKNATLYQNARTFLTILRDQGPFEATNTGNLKRKTVSLMMDELDFPERYLAEVRDMNKTINETDLWKLHILRKLLEVAGLIRLHDNKFKLVKKHAGLLREGHEGALYRQIFSIYFLKMNLSFVGGGREWRYLQEATPYSIYQLARLSNKWHHKEELFDLMLLGSAKNELIEAQGPYGYPNPLQEFYYQLLNPLVQFGLLDSKFGEEDSDDPYAKPDFFKPTPLVDKLITINIQK